MQFALVCAAGVVAFLVAEKRRSPAGRWLAKPVASAGFVAVAWSRGALDSAYGRWVLAATSLIGVMST